MATKIIHDKYYNFTQILFENPEFKQAIRNIKSGFMLLGCGLPTDGLANEKAFQIWNEEYFACRKRRKKKPELYNEVLRQILKKFELDPKDKFHYETLRGILFFNKIEPETIPLYTKEIWNKKTKNQELYIRVFPHTTRRDINKAWPWIAKEKKITFKKTPHPNEWTGQKRDLMINELSERLNKISLKSRRSTYGYTTISRIIIEHFGDKIPGKLSPEIIRQAKYKVKKYQNSL